MTNLEAGAAINLPPSEQRPLTAWDIIKMKVNKRPIVALTAYDATFARLEDEAGTDVILVGDSLGMVIQGHKNTLPVTIDEMIYHTKACARTIKHALLVSDMPFMSYQTSTRDAMVNAGRCIKEGGASAVKLEGGEFIAETVSCLVKSGIPVMGHIGMRPQMVNVYGGFKLQGKSDKQAQQIIKDAKAIQDAGAFSIVLEKIPMELAKVITNELTIPTIGIAAGPHCDGQILVNFDMLGLSDQYNFRFVRKYAELGSTIREAVTKYAQDIRNGNFPSEEESF